MISFLSSQLSLFYIFDHFRSSFTYNLSCYDRSQYILALVILALAAYTIVFRFIPFLARAWANGDRRRFFLNRAFVSWAWATLLGGWFVYMVGFCENGTAHSLVAFIVRPFLSSLEQFVFHSDLFDVSEECLASPWFMTAYTVLYFSAVLISSIIVVNCLRNRIVFFFKRLYWSVVSCHTINVFFEINDKSICLAKSINVKERGRTIFVQFPKASDEHQGHNSLSRIFGLNTFDKQQMLAIKGLKSIVINASSELFDEDMTDDRSVSPYALESNGLDRLIKPLKRAHSIRLFFLSENENENVRAGINMANSHVLAGRDVEIYCKARQSYENYTLFDSSTNALFHLVDDSSYAVNSLKVMDWDKTGTPIAHPINYVKVNSALGVVESAFNCMVVGFGQTGQDAMRFLYEFGSFVGRTGGKSPFHCKITDKDMNSCLGYVASEIPALQIGDGSVADSDKPISNREIELIQCDVHSDAFWNELERDNFINKLNCIVVALGSDEENISLATKLYEFALRHDAVGNKEGNCLKIFVRGYNSDEEARLRNVESFYRKENDVIRIFGEVSDIYSYDVIIKNKIQEQAKEFFESYNTTLGFNEEWDARHDKLRTGTIDQKVEIRIKEKQDRYNALHQFTKLQLLGITSSGASVRQLPSTYPFITEQQLVGNMKRYYGNAIPCNEDDELQLWHTRLENVSKCEHLRWNSAMYMLGFVYVDAQKKDFRKRQHKYLVDWDQLDNGVRMYDYKVVETTVSLIQFQSQSDNK